LFWRFRNFVRAEHPTYLAFMTRRLQEVQLPLEEQAAAEQAFAADVRRLQREAVLSWVLLPGVVKVNESSRRKQAYLRSLSAALATERYRQAHGAWPATLDVLVPDFLPTAPGDPYDGQPLRCRRLPDGVAIYSVGGDRTDDGGAFKRGNELQPGTDVGCRLWDVARRRQPPPPRPPQPALGQPPPHDRAARPQPKGPP
jgi:hypothetical protein